MDPFASFAEDALPRSAPRPTVSSAVPSCAAPTVPEVSFLNAAGAVQLPAALRQPAHTASAPPTSYTAWKQQNIVPNSGGVDSKSPASGCLTKKQPAGTFPAPQSAQRKQVTFDTLPPPSAAAPTTPPAPAQPIPLPAALGPCSQLELSAFQPPPLPVPVPNIRIGAASSVNPAQASNPFGHALQPPSLPAEGANWLEIVRQLVANQQPPIASTNPFIELRPATPLRQEPQPHPRPPSQEIPNFADLMALFSQLAANATARNPPPPTAPSTSQPPIAAELDLPQLHSLLIHQQEQIHVLQQQVKHLLTVVEERDTHRRLEAEQTATAADQLALGEEASTIVASQPQQNSSEARTPARSQHNPSHPQQLQGNHNSPADWKFYGNTLEQVLDVLHNSPGSGQPRRAGAAAAAAAAHQVQNLFQVSEVQGANYRDVNVSATQRVMYHQHTGSRGGQQAKAAAAPASITDRSVAMNALALKYLDESGLQALVAQSQQAATRGAGDQQQQTSPLMAPGRGASAPPPDLSAPSLEYLVKYGLLQNRRLFDGNGNNRM